MLWRFELGCNVSISSLWFGRYSVSVKLKPMMWLCQDILSASQNAVDSCRSSLRSARPAVTTLVTECHVPPLASATIL